MKPRFRIYHGNLQENYIHAVNTPAKLYVAEQKFKLWELMDISTKQILHVFGSVHYYS